jgi:hypothetical protein
MERAERIERRFEVPIVVGALLVIPILVAEQASPGKPWATLAAVGNWLVWLLFLAEVVVMLAVVPDRARWLRAHPLEVAIVVPDAAVPPGEPAGAPRLPAPSTSPARRRCPLRAPALLPRRAPLRGDPGGLDRAQGRGRVRGGRG